MKVIFIKSHPMYGYFVGDEAEIQKPETLIEEGFVEEVKAEEEDNSGDGDEGDKKKAKK